MAHAPCYMSGARIRTALGERPVETIRSGDLVDVLRDGRSQQEPVTWVGSTAVDLARHAHAEAAAPIRIRKDAIADNQPVRDLFVSPEHCLVVNERCVPAKLLVNGGSIVSERDHPPFTYHHIELEKHGILLAENTPAESYLDTGNRGLFDHADGVAQLHPVFEVNAESARWVTDACAPLATLTDDVVPIWRRLAERSAHLGYPIPEVATVAEADVHIVADGRSIQPLSSRDQRYVFAIPAGTGAVLLMSRYCIPSDQMIDRQRDTRRLGVRVNWMTMCSKAGETIIPADHPDLDSGWHDAEHEGERLWRWTDGAATIPWDSSAGSTILTVCCAPVERYPVYDSHARLVA